MKLIVTGATGFIGKAVVRNALARGHAVTAPVRDVGKARQIFGTQDRLTLQTCTGLGDIPLEGGGRLIHLAWREVGKYADPANLTANLAEQFDFLKRAADEGIDDLTVAGTCLEYGLQEGTLSEEGSCRPVTYYGLAKLTLLRMLEIAQQQGMDFRLKWLRYFYAYGPGQRPQALLSQLDAALMRGDESFNMSPGDQSRDFIHVDTVAQNTVSAALQDSVTGPINVGNGQGRQVLEMARHLLAARGREIRLNTGHYPYASYEPFSFHADITKLKTMPGAITDNEIRM